MAVSTTSSDLWEVMSTARMVRRYRDAPVPDEVLRRCLEAATWAPSGGNQQPWRFVVVTDPETRAVIGAAARATWEIMTGFYGLSVPDPEDTSTRARTVRSMYEHMMNGATVPLCVLFCVKPMRGESELQTGGSIWPALHNFALAARAQGLGTAVTLWQDQCDAELRARVGIPEDWKVASILTGGWPQGGHGPLSRKPVTDVVAVDQWDHALA